MEHILLFVSVSVFLFQIFQSANSTFDGVVSSDLSLSKYYEKSVKDLVSERLSGTKFCESILLPTDHTLRKSLQGTLFSAKNDTYLDDKDRLDSCCRFLHKCDAYKNIELNYTNERNILHCECVHSFRICLKKINTSISSDLAFIHSINTTKCYAKNHPIIKCVELEAHLGSTTQYLRSMSSTLNDTFFNRCTKYELDESQPQELQLFDLPFIDPGMNTIATVMVKVIGDNNTDTSTHGDTNPKKVDDLKPPIMLEILKSVAKIGCEQLSDIDKEQRDSRNLGNEITRESLKLFKKMLIFYCDNKKLIESESLEMCPYKVFNIYGGTNIFN